MEIKLDTSGLDDLAKKLKDLEGEHQVPLNDLMPDEFIQRHSNYQTLDEMIEASGIGEDGDLDSEEFSSFISQNAQFDSWDEMISEAGSEYVQRQLNF